MRILPTFIFLLLSSQLFGQTNKKISKNKKDDIIQKLDAINTLLKSYGTLSPFSENENRFEMIDSIGNEITTRLLNILNDERIVNYPIETLLNQDEISVSKSKDDKIFFFSIEEKTGGSYRTTKTIIHYRLLNGSVKADIFSGEDSDALATSTYDQVFLLDSINQKYFVIGGVLTCNTCFVSSAITIQLDSNSFQTELIAQFDGRFDDLKVFEFDNISKILTYEYFAADNDDSLYGGNNEYLGLQNKFHSKFKFINGEFLELEKCEWWDEK